MQQLALFATIRIICRIICPIIRIIVLHNKQEWTGSCEHVRKNRALMRTGNNGHKSKVEDKWADDEGPVL